MTDSAEYELQLQYQGYRTCVCKVFSMTHTVGVVDLSLILDLEV